MHYKLQPLFRALIIIYDHNVTDGGDPIVHLVRIGDTAGLSAPIVFGNIEPVFDTVPGLFSNVPGDDTITTTLSSASSFVTALEFREQAAFTPNKTRDPSILDEDLGSKKNRDKFAQDLGYTGPEILGPSTNWIELAEGKEMTPPATIFTLMTRNGLKLDATIDLSKSPHLSCREKRLDRSLISTSSWKTTP